MSDIAKKPVKPAQEKRPLGWSDRPERDKLPQDREDARESFDALLDKVSKPKK